MRTSGIYTIMITLAIAAAFFYFVNQNYPIFNGHTGINGIPAPVFWGVDWRQSTVFYYVTLFFGTASSWPSCTCRARRSGWPCRASGTIRAA